MHKDTKNRTGFIDCGFEQGVFRHGQSRAHLSLSPLFAPLNGALAPNLPTLIVLANSSLRQKELSSPWQGDGATLVQGRLMIVLKP